LVKTPLNESPFKNAILASTILNCLDVCSTYSYTHTSLYDHHANIAKNEEIFSVF
jgi:hypothetical protein